MENLQKSLFQRFQGEIPDEPPRTPSYSKFDIRPSKFWPCQNADFTENQVLGSLSEISRYIYKDPSIISICKICNSCCSVYEVGDDGKGYHICPLFLNDPKTHQEVTLDKPKEGFHRRKLFETARGRDFKPGGLGSLRDFKTLPASSYSSLLPYQTPQVKSVFEEIFGSHVPKVIVDATSHIGGDTLNFARMYPRAKIIAMDVDPGAVTCLKTNIIRAGLECECRIKVILADCTVYIPKVQILADLYYIDPPWYGPSYVNQEEVFLSLGGRPVVELVNLILEKSLSPRVVLKVPRNFAYQDFKKSVLGETRLFYIRKPQKKNSVAYGLVLITPKVER